MNNETNKNKLTTSWGAPVGDNQNSMTAGSRGPTLIQDVHLLEKLAHFNRERVPERVVHAKGAGAHGYFEVTNDLSNYTKASFLSDVGKRTPMFIRFSTVAGELGSADTVRDPRGFAVKFYTEEGNYDFVGNNTPVFFIRDAIKFPDFIHTQKRHPQTHLKNPNAVWDFWSLSPESLHQVTILMSDRGIPATLRHMHGFGSHTFKWVNAEGQGVWVKYHFKTEQGVKNLDVDLAAKLAGENPDYHTEDLFNAIEKGDFPAWKLCVQIMPLEDADTYRFDPFDVTKVWSQKDYPLIEVGRMVLESKSQRIILPKSSKRHSLRVHLCLESKLLRIKCYKVVYSPMEMHIVTALALTIIHCQSTVPVAEVNNYQRDGQMRSDSNGAGLYITSQTAMVELPNHRQISQRLSRYPGWLIVSLMIIMIIIHKPGDLYRLLARKNALGWLQNIVGAMTPVEKDEIKLRQISHFYKADPAFGQGIADGLGLPLPQID